MRAVNLLPTDRTAAKRSAGLDPNRRNLLIASGVVGALVITGLSVMVWSSSSSVSDKNKQLSALQSQIASTPTDTSLQSSLGTRKATVESLVANRLSWDQFLGALSKVMPEDVWLQNLQSTVPGAAATIASEQAAAAAAVAAAKAATTTTTSSTTTTPAPVAAPTVPSTFLVTGFTYSQPSVARMMRRLSIVPWLSNVSLVSSSKSQIGADIVFTFSVKATVVSPQVIP